MPFSLVHLAAWSQHRTASPSPQRTYGHLRSLSTLPPSNVSVRSRSPAKSHSSSNITEIMVPSEGSLLPSPPRKLSSAQSLMEDADHSTIPDPRLQASPATGRSTPAPQHHPDLDQEVATLSTKLINAINHQTTLDDTLSATRQDLAASRERVAELEALVAQQQETLSGDVWIRRSTAENEKGHLRELIAEEKRYRIEVEKEKRKIEQELETLTVSLFEEANKMVITAKEEGKREQEILQRKNDQLRAQLADTEGLLKSQQEQLAELKLVMEQMTAERDDHSGTTPSSPGFSKFDPRDDETQISEGPSQTGPMEPYSPTYPTNLHHLVHPVLRNDISAYDDFVTLIKTSKRAPSSRASSGSYTGLNPILSLTGSSSISAPSNASTASLSTTAAPASTNVPPQRPHTPASSISAPPAVFAPLPALKETKFYKRVLAEDIEPTLRLDTAPGLSWLARRSVISAMTEGTLVVEPVPTNSPFASISKPQFYTCSLCGETRKDETHLRNHRFRTSESDSAQRYPLCKYCLGRVRSTCDFLGFLRMVKDGHWRADDPESERAAWEESVRLREQMFWSRIGGGVVPMLHSSHAHSSSIGGRSIRTSHEAARTLFDETRPTTSCEPSTESSESGSTLKSKEPLKDTEYPGLVISTSEETAFTTATVQRSSVPEIRGLPQDPNDENMRGADHSQRLSLTIPTTFRTETAV
ncbi:hypothetical protein F4810DRAFT_376716 [Camillea tinctor]|nr:hypothetical protein F4810DRAFT_376716 [Camillea tinctor]